MKRIHTSLKGLAAIALVALAVGCSSSNPPQKENLALAAGFKVITPNSPNQQAILAKLAADKVTRVQVKGKTYWVLPDAKNNQAYVGTADEYASYRNLRLQNKLSNENLEAAEAPKFDVVSWGGWGQW